ncbi:hypothetical protein J5N97_002181 [Dioscorea zingiberensis]|uniref:Alpha/beta hydrolase fold-3 domain-containing protein n=1 Tax=Dioscorea zingiberensis TaxID=325984 RepID=A0A9D5D1P8_9LILI|nr:hypothetical protein J5N97_002181 [Dioscorea zingiberensis]
MAVSNEVDREILNLLRIYKDGHMERLSQPDIVPAGFDHINGVSSKDVSIDPSTGVSARLYLPKQVENQPGKKVPVLVYYHGGGFCIESAFSSLYHNYLNSLSSKANILIVSVEYRLAPEHPLPAGYEDSWQALQWVVSESSTDNDSWLQSHADFGRVFVSGDSAGGNIAHNMVMKIGCSSSEGMKKIKGLVLAQPYFWGLERLECEIAKPGNESSIDAESVDQVWPLVCPGSSGYSDPRVNPFAEGAPSLEGLGCEKVMVCVAGKDLVRGRGRLYYEKLISSGFRGKVEFLESQGEDHVFQLFNPGCDKALEMMNLLVDFFNSQ